VGHHQADRYTCYGSPKRMREGKGAARMLEEIMWENESDLILKR
jgi:hypothetical protein